jgi:hypothetical protein
VLGTGKVLLWDALGAGGLAGRLRVYADADAVWFTLNASWNGSAWARDSLIYFAGGLRLSRNELELLHENRDGATFATWARTWRLPMGALVNSGFETSGAIQETGRLSVAGTNTASANQPLLVGGSVTFRSRFAIVPSSITLAKIQSSDNWSGLLVVAAPDRDGFAFSSTQQVPGGESVWWLGAYTAVA